MPFRHVFGTVFSFDYVIAAIVFVAVAGFLVYAIVRYRAGAGRKEASQETEHPKLEGVYVFGVLLLAVGIVSFTARENSADYPAHPKPTMQVVVTGFQWCWQFHYVEADVTQTADCAKGQYPTLVLPVGKTVALSVTSSDVIHAFWIPEFKYKIDAFPHHVNQFDITIPEAGVWPGHCAEFCGLGHDTMLFYLRALPPAQFQTWLSAQPKTKASS